MEGGIAVVMAAVLTGVVPAVLAAWVGLKRLRRDNSEQHGETGGLLRSIDRRTEKISDDVVDLQVWTARHEERHKRIEAE